MPLRQRGPAIHYNLFCGGRQKRISLSERIRPGGRFYPRPNEFIRAGLTPQSVKVLVVVIVKWLKCIGILLKFTGDLPAVIAYKLVFSEISTTAAASDTETTKLQPYAYWYKIDARHFLLSNYPF